MMVEIRKGKLHLNNEIIIDIEVVDQGENLDPNEKGSIPNHDKIMIVYPKKE